MCRRPRHLIASASLPHQHLPQWCHRQHPPQWCQHHRPPWPLAAPPPRGGRHRYLHRYWGWIRSLPSIYRSLSAPPNVLPARIASGFLTLTLSGSAYSIATIKAVSRCLPRYLIGVRLCTCTEQRAAAHGSVCNHCSAAACMIAEALTRLRTWPAGPPSVQFGDYFYYAVRPRPEQCQPCSRSVSLLGCAGVGGATSKNQGREITVGVPSSSRLGAIWLNRRTLARAASQCARRQKHQSNIVR